MILALVFKIWRSFSFTILGFVSTYSAAKKSETSQNNWKNKCFFVVNTQRRSNEKINYSRLRNFNKNCRLHFLMGFFLLIAEVFMTIFSFIIFALLHTFCETVNCQGILYRSVIFIVLDSTLRCLASTKRSNILKQTCSRKLQVCLSISDLFVDTKHWKVNSSSFSFLYVTHKITLHKNLTWFISNVW